MVNIREQDSWVHTDIAEATRKAGPRPGGGAPGAVPQAARAVAGPGQPGGHGGGRRIAGIHAALTVANAGKHAYLVERELDRRAHGPVRQDLPDA
jgi:heterodisulfide reductase subunit A